MEECVLDFNNQECHMANGSVRDYAIVRASNTLLTQKMFQFIAQSLFSPTSVARSLSALDTTHDGPLGRPLRMLSDIIQWWVY